MQQQLPFDYQLLAAADQLEPADLALLNKARHATAAAYAPYSQFRVAAAALLDNGEVVAATNQENASYPVGICAERSLLSTISAVYPDNRILVMALSYSNAKGVSNQPISPCGICRQSLAEYESRYQQPVKLIMSGLEGPVYIIPNTSQLLPLRFSASDMLR